MVNFKRWLKHLFMPPWAWKRAFPQATLDAIEAAIRGSETSHDGEIRFAIESSLPASAVWRGMRGRERAVEVFSSLRVWDTEHNSGVLVYLLLADHDIEIVADRGIAARVDNAAWEAWRRPWKPHSGRVSLSAGHWMESNGLARCWRHIFRLACIIRMNWRIAP